MGEVGRGLVVADDVNALLFGIGGDARQVEIGIWFGEAEIPAIGEPVTVPADVPSFDQHPGNPAGGGEIDQFERIGGGRTTPSA